ncbi:MAG TPA: glycosyltransferase family A protein [Microthrixaceae bacterium]|nr:glycosyltransferase family A protein [Microthrixaceae bacterium]
MVIPVRNNADVISRCVAGVLAQTFAALEVIVVDSSSTDQSAEAVRVVADDRVRLMLSGAEPGDIAGARRHGTDRARGSWTLLLDPHDEVEPAWLARLGRLIDSTSAGFVSCGGVQRFSDGSEASIVPIRMQFPGGRGTGSAGQPVPRGEARVTGQSGVAACLRPGSFAAPSERFRSVDPVKNADPVNLGLALIAAATRADEPVVCTPESLLRWNDPMGVLVDEAEVETGDALRLRWATQAIDALARTPIPDGDLLARYATVGGVAAARLGQNRQARRLFGVARSAGPRMPEHWVRWVASCLPLATGRILRDTKVV